ncbi:unnamed protein product [Sphagnum balticum]
MTKNVADEKDVNGCGDEKPAANGNVDNGHVTETSIVVENGTSNGGGEPAAVVDCDDMHQQPCEEDMPPVDEATTPIPAQNGHAHEAEVPSF